MGYWLASAKMVFHTNCGKRKLYIWDQDICGYTEISYLIIILLLLLLLIIIIIIIERIHPWAKQAKAPIKRRK